jgi:drug/metabolite transporter (DMT)-like permease
LIGAESLRPIKLIGIVLAAAGILILIDPRKASISSQTTVGDAMIILNSLSYGVFVGTSKNVITRNGAFRSIMWIFIFASVICVPAGFVSLSISDTVDIGPHIWLLVLYIAVVVTAGPYLLNAFALSKVNPSTVAVYIYLQPIIGFVLAAVFLAEPIDLRFVIAAALVFVGVYLTTRQWGAQVIRSTGPA